MLHAYSILSQYNGSKCRIVGISTKCCSSHTIYCIVEESQQHCQNTYRIVENIHELLEALRFPESDADFPISGKDLQRFQCKMLNDREVGHDQVQDQRDAARLEHRLATFVVLHGMHRTHTTVCSKQLTYIFFFVLRRNFSKGYQSRVEDNLQ